jgi:hypothetical protein
MPIEGNITNSLQKMSDAIDIVLGIYHKIQ